MPHAAPTPPRVAPQAGAKASKTILIVDPDAEHRERVIRVLREAAEGTDEDKLTFQEAENGAAAWALVEVVKPDLVVAEILLEGFSGMQLLRRLKERYGTEAPAVFFVTELSHEVDRYWALRNGAAAFVVKPYEDEFLRKRGVKFFEAGDGELELDSSWPLDS